MADPRRSPKPGSVAPARFAALRYHLSMPQRRYVHPEPGDDLAAIAARECPEVEDPNTLLSWNLHLAARPGGRGSVLPSDLVFVEPPLKAQ